MDKEMRKRITEACRGTADPERARRELVRLLESVPDAEPFSPWFKASARLFSASQFLSNFCMQHPEELLEALAVQKDDITREFLMERASEALPLTGETPPDEAMRLLRGFKKRYLLRITLRDVTGRTDIITSMQELSFLAECLLERTLDYALSVMRRRFGAPATGGVMSLIALGKLGGEELNYSSDVDIIALYDDRDEEGETVGVPGPSGVLSNRISNHEYYCKTVEYLNKVLSTHTEDGIAYRVDLRLRPQGQRGEIALPLISYRDYFQNWARTWERMAYIRARPVAGDRILGERFIEMVEPFVWKKTLDFTEVEEIRSLKKKIDSTISKDDIKRGYGGIREAEFFVQTFQLIYGAEQSSLRTYRLFNAIQGLRWMKLVPDGELSALWDGYLFLRRLEHYLQMKDDLQTHTLPSEDLGAVGKVMGFNTEKDFLIELRVKRMQIKNMYNSLLGTAEDVHAEALALIEGDLSDEEMTGYLAFRGMRKPEEGLSSLKEIREHLEALWTLKERASIRKVVPVLIENALGSLSPERAVAGIERMFRLLGIKEAYLAALTEKRELMEGVVGVFALSSHLTRSLLSTPRYLNILIEEMPIRRSMKRTEETLARSLAGARDISAAMAIFRNVEEIRLGMLFLTGILTDDDLTRYLSHTADAMIRAAVVESGADVCVIAMGKLGGREITFGSDLDLIFVAETEEGMKAAEQVIKLLSAYTKRGVPYSIDARLRPDGTKGPLVNDVEGYRDYYRQKAHKWEIQALLKARPVGGSEALGRAFISMAKDVIMERGKEVRKKDISEMRARIVSELAREGKGLDIKLGPGGIEEIEFHIQMLQLRNAKKYPEVVVQNTVSAVRRLAGKGVIRKKQKAQLLEAYGLFRKLEAFLRINGEQVFGLDEEIALLAGKFMGFRDGNELFERLNELRRNISYIVMH